MTIEVKKIKTTEEVSTVQLKLPAYFKNSGNGSFRINEDESYVEVFAGTTLGSIHTYDADSYDCKRDISRIAACQEITEQDFFDAYYRVLNKATKHLQAKPITELVEA